jgi:hypothetical protein
VAFLYLVVAAPMLLGSAWGATLTALGAHEEHFCACGMTPNTCGCPACAKLGKLRAQERARDLQDVVVRSSCDDSPAPPGVASLPPAVLTPSFTVAPAPLARHELHGLGDRAPPRGRDRPPTPPPRSLAAA